MSLRPLSSIDAPVLIVAAGFEDRAVAFLQDCAASGRRFAEIVVIEYAPQSRHNHIPEVLSLSTTVGESVRRIRFNRYDPGETNELEGDQLAALLRGRKAVVDISAMSRFLIVMLVSRLRRLGSLDQIVYFQPLAYFPTHEQWLTIHREAPTTALFLTTGLYALSTVSDLTTATMQGAPEVLVASPTFEPAFLRTVLSEQSPARLVLLEGAVPSEDNKWREGAVRELNEFAFEIYGAESISVRTDEYLDTVKVLRRLFETYKYSHRLVVAPAPSKLSAVGIGLCAAEGVLFEVIYPTPVGFHENSYTTGVGEGGVVDLSDSNLL